MRVVLPKCHNIYIVNGLCTIQLLSLTICLLFFLLFDMMLFITRSLSLSSVCISFPIGALCLWSSLSCAHFDRYEFDPLTVNYYSMIMLIVIVSLSISVCLGFLLSYSICFFNLWAIQFCVRPNQSVGQSNSGLRFKVNKRLTSALGLIQFGIMDLFILINNSND